MNTYQLEPHDPLLVRDGRPFAAGGVARSLPFVMPTTLSGLIRTLAGSSSGTFDAEPSSLRTLATRGPLLCDDRGILYFPAPRDAVCFGDGDAFDLLSLVPTPLPAGTLTDADGGGLGLMPLMLPGEPKGKPVSPPAFWAWHSYRDWLQGTLMASDLRGHSLRRDERLHVSLDSATGTAREGALFGTSSLDFQTPQGDGLSLVFCTDAVLTPGAVPFGGERRLSVLRETDVSLPECPDVVRQHIVKHGTVRLLLLTPAMFTLGWRPSWLLEQTTCPVVLRAAATGRPTVVSGWNFEAPGGPKPTRRLAPEGSVYFLELGGDAQARADWVAEHWLACVSDDAQDRLDGLGLAALGLWRPA